MLQYLEYWHCHSSLYCVGMPWTYLVDQTLDGIRLRVSATDTGFVVTKVAPGERGQSLRITRNSFAPHEREQVGHHCVAEALAIGESATLALRQVARLTARHAWAAKATMRPGCRAIRQFERDAITKTEIYLRLGRDLAQACAHLEQALDQAGFPTGERLLPIWIEQLFEGSTSRA